MATSYNLRQSRRKDYRQLSSQPLPRAERVRAREDDLYDVEVVEKDGDKVKVQYIGYSQKHDEWIDAVDVVSRQPPATPGTLQLETYRPLDMHRYSIVQTIDNTDCLVSKYSKLQAQMLFWTCTGTDCLATGIDAFLAFSLCPRFIAEHTY